MSTQVDDNDHATSPTGASGPADLSSPTSSRLTWEAPARFVPALTLLGFAHATGPEGAAPTISEGWRASFEGVSGVYCAFASAAGATIELPDVRGDIHLRFCCSPWSGRVQLSFDGRDPQIIDLHAASHEIRDVACRSGDARSSTFRLTVLEDRNPAARSTEVWLHGVYLGGSPEWLPVSQVRGPRLSLVDGRHGCFAVMNNDVFVSRQITTSGTWGERQIVAFEKLVRPGSTAIDIGANVGHHAVLLSRLVGPEGRLLCFEPQARVLRLLRANLALNGCSNAVVFECALGHLDTDGVMDLIDYDREANVGGLRVGLAGRGGLGCGGEAVPLRRLDGVIAELAAPLGPISFIKCDAQGFDYFALLGAERVLRQHRPAIMAEVAPALLRDLNVDYLDFYQYLEGLGYRLFDAGSPSPGVPAPTRPDGDEEWDVLALQPGHLDEWPRAARKGTR